MSVLFRWRLVGGLMAILLVAGACGNGGENRETSQLTDEEIWWLDWQRQIGPSISDILPTDTSAPASDIDASSGAASATTSIPVPSVVDSTPSSVVSTDTDRSATDNAATGSATTTTASMPPAMPATATPATTTPTTTTAATPTMAPTTTAPTTTVPAEILDGPGELKLTWPLPYGEPGELIDIEHLGEFNGDFSGHRILYHSRNKDGDDIAVSGYALVPLSDHPPAGGYPVVAYAHGTTGMADRCAPSAGVESSLSRFRLDETLVTKTLVQMGYAVVATDYEGLGTPGLHPYLVGKSEANSVLDSVRALRDWGGDRFSTTFAAVGVSQGGHAALHAGQYWQDYAPELDLAGVIAVAPPSQFESIETSYETDLGKTFLMMIFGAYADAYDEIDPSDILTPQGIALLEELEKRCISSLTEIFAPLDIRQLQAVPNPLTIPKIREIARQNDVNQRALPAPLLIVHGSDDKIVDYDRSAQLCPQIIGLPQQGPTQMITFVGEDHYTITLASASDMAQWLEDRLAGEPMTEVGCDKRKDTVVAEVLDFYRGVRGAYDTVRDFFGNLGRSISDFFTNLFN